MHEEHANHHQRDSQRYRQNGMTTQCPVVLFLQLLHLLQRTPLLFRKQVITHLLQRLLHGIRGGNAWQVFDLPLAVAIIHRGIQHTGHEGENILRAGGTGCTCHVQHRMCNSLRTHLSAGMTNPLHHLLQDLRGIISPALIDGNEQSPLLRVMLQ